jgi:hypothetical protein
MLRAMKKLSGQKVTALLHQEFINAQINILRAPLAVIDRHFRRRGDGSGRWKECQSSFWHGKPRKIICFVDLGHNRFNVVTGVSSRFLFRIYQPRRDLWRTMPQPCSESSNRGNAS